MPFKSSPHPFILFIKPWCPWCEEAVEWLDQHGYKYESLNVTRDAASAAEMRELTGQTKAPCIEIDGEVLADFDVGQLEAWLKKLAISPT